MRALACETLGVSNADRLRHPDMIELSVLPDATQIPVDDVREARRRLSLRPTTERGYVVCVYEADRLNLASVNALLRTLEQPSGKTLFLLRAPYKEDLPETLVSRCQVVEFASLRPGREKCWENDPEAKEAFLKQMDQCQTLLHASTGDRLRFAKQEGGESRDRASEWLDRFEEMAHRHLMAEPDRANRWVRICKAIDECRHGLARQLPSQFILEHLVLAL